MQHRDPAVGAVGRGAARDGAAVPARRGGDGGPRLPAPQAARDRGRAARPREGGRRAPAQGRGAQPRRLPGLRAHDADEQALLVRLLHQALVVRGLE